MMFVCEYHGGDRPNWTPKTVEAEDKYKARWQAMTEWLGHDPNHSPTIVTDLRFVSITPASEYKPTKPTLRQKIANFLRRFVG